MSFERSLNGLPKERQTKNYKTFVNTNKDANVTAERSRGHQQSLILVKAGQLNLNGGGDNLIKLTRVDAGVKQFKFSLGYCTGTLRTNREQSIYAAQFFYKRPIFMGSRKANKHISRD